MSVDERDAVVTLLPLEADIVVRDGESVMAAAQRLGYFWPTRCRGQALCTACFFEIVTEDDSFNEIAPREQSALDALSSVQAKRPGQLRLGCQARPRRPATIFKLGVKVADAPRPYPEFFT